MESKLRYLLRGKRRLPNTKLFFSRSLFTTNSKFQSETAWLLLRSLRWERSAGNFGILTGGKLSCLAGNEKKHTLPFNEMLNGILNTLK